MHPLIAKLLKKLGVENLKDLSEDDQREYKNWQNIFSTEDVTLDKVVEFCNSQLHIIEMQWKDLNNAPQKNERLILLHTVYATLVELITAPSKQRENLEDYLRGLLLKD